MITLTDSQNSVGLSWVSQWTGARLKYGVKLINDKAENVFNYIGLENVESWTGRLAKNSELTDSNNKEDAATGNRFYPGNVLFGKLRPYLAKAFVAEDYGCCTSELLVFCPLKYDSNYLKCLILTPDFINLINSSAYGAKMPRASWDFIGNIVLPTPPLQIQKSIARFLDRKTTAIDTLIAKKQRLIQLLEEKRTALINQAVTKGLNPNAPMKDSGSDWIGKTPTHWEIRQLKYLCVLQRGFDLPSQERKEGHYPIYGGGGITGYHNTAMVQAPGIVTGRCGTVGEVYFIEEPFWPLNTSLYVKEFWGNSPGFIKYLLSVIPIKSYSAKSAVPGVDRNDLHIIPVPRPPRKEQDLIVQYLEQVSNYKKRMTETIECQIEKLQEYRRSLITAAVTGKLEISEVEADV